jgi:GT2 family glycosyltransferase
MKLSIVIVNYNTKTQILSCLQSLSDIGQNDEYEVYVVDNDSKDDSVTAIRKQAPWVKILENRENIGFAKANNQALRLAKGKYILLLNPDTKIIDGAITKTMAFLEKESEISAITCRVEFENSKMDPACHRGFPTPWASFCYYAKLEKLFPSSTLFGQYHQTYKNITEPHEIDCPSGCFYLVREDIIKKIGLLDESYFLYGEDVDWSYRIKQAGGKIYFYPDAKIIHYKGISSGIKKETSAKTQASVEIRRKSVNHFYDAMKIFYSKYYKQKYPFFINWVVYAGISVKRNISLRRLKV